MNVNPGEVSPLIRPFFWGGGDRAPKQARLIFALIQNHTARGRSFNNFNDL